MCDLESRVKNLLHELQLTNVTPSCEALENWIDTSENDVDVRIESLKIEVEERGNALLEEVNEIERSLLKGSNEVFHVEKLLKVIPQTKARLQLNSKMVGVFYRHKPKPKNILKAIKTDDLDAFLYYFHQNKIPDDFTVVDNSKWVNQSGETLLHFAADAGSLKIVKTIINDRLTMAGCLHDRDKIEQTPLFSALWDGLTETVKYLTRKGSDVNIVDQDDYTALDFATSMGDYVEIVEFLLDEIRPETRADVMQSCLEKALRHKRQKIADLLMKRGANINLIHFCGPSCQVFHPVSNK